MNEILDSDEAPSSEYTTKSYQNFKYSLFAIFFFIVGVFAVIITGINSHILTLVFVLPLFIAIPLSLMGFIRGVQSILHKEPNSAKMMTGLIGNLIIVGLFLSLIIMNVLDIVRMAQ